MLVKDGTSFAEEFAVCKRGFNWRFDFEEEPVADGGKRTVVRCQLLLKTASDLKQIISPYPYDAGRREDASCEAIREAVGAAYLTGRENGVEVRECGSMTIVEEGIDGEVARGFAEDLAKINRVIVVMHPMTKGGQND